MIKRPQSVQELSGEQEMRCLSDEEKIQYILEQPLRGLHLLSRASVGGPIGSDELREPLIRELLIMVKACKDYGVPLTIIERLRKIGYNWSELDVIERSLRIDLQRQGFSE